MSKLSGPLFSLSASGQLAKTLVFAKWKGVDYARQYVIPANPNSAAQQTQRGYLETALAQWHDVSSVLIALDKTNLNRKASVSHLILSGFNQYVKMYIDSRVAGATPNQLFNTIEAAVAEPDASITIATAAATASVVLRWGTSATSLINIVNRTEGGAPGVLHTFAIEDLVAGQVIFYECYDSTASSVRTGGIGRFVVTA